MNKTAFVFPGQGSQSVGMLDGLTAYAEIAECVQTANQVLNVDLLKMINGDVPITKYETPGGQAFADTILPFVEKSNIIVLANHGTVSYGETVEKAYWWTEILDAYCRILLLSRNLGNVQFLSEEKERELLTLKKDWGYEDPRNTPEYKDCDVCANDIFRHSWADSNVERRAFAAPPAMPVGGSPITAAAAPPPSTAPPAAPAGFNQEALIQTITDRVMAEMNGR